MAISRRGAQVKGNGCGPEPESGKISGFAPRGACPNTMSSIALPADISTLVAPEPRPGKPAPAEAMACMPAPSEAEFRQALGQFATGVTVVTGRDDAGRPVGLTVSSFNSVSLQPPLVLWSLKGSSPALPAFTAGRPYAIHVLSAGQLALAERFAGPREQRWLGLSHGWSAAGVPLLEGCLARFECRAHSAHAEGDHVILVARVERCEKADALQPLLYHRGRLLAGAEL